MWQILSSDYDTQASFYGVKKACEPLHVQLDLSNYSVAVVNHDHGATRDDGDGERRIRWTTSSCCSTRRRKMSRPTTVTAGFKLELVPLLGNPTARAQRRRAGEAGTAKLGRADGFRQPLLAWCHQRYHTGN